MNVILILIDSLNRHYLPAYGCKDVKSPNIDQLAQKGVVFTNHIIGSAPCMPARRELMTGRREFMFRGWGALEPFDAPIARELREAGAVTQMVTDHYHYWENKAHGYIEHFDGCEMIRGHEFDFWKTERQPNEPDWVKDINKHRPGAGSRYYRNVAHFKGEEDFFSPKVFKAAAEWLDANHNQDSFFLKIESFDTHEPFHVPEPYRSMYTQDLNPDYTCWPPYQQQEHRTEFFRNTTLAELEYVRAQYKGKLTMVDTALGRIWAAMDKYKLWDNTMVILTTDHGHELAEAVTDLSQITDDGRDATGRVPYAKQHPHYMSNANIPLMVWHPDMLCGGRRVDQMTTAVDIYPTILEALGADSSVSPHGRSILPILAGQGTGREFHYWGMYGYGICCTDGEHILLQGSNSEAPLYWYSAMMRTPFSDCESGKFIPGVDCPVWRIPMKFPFDFPSILCRRDDPLFKEKNIIAERPDIAARLRKRLRTQLEVDGCPPEQYDRLGL
ncbi:MAG: sulfatase [Armatimonadota bacterium]|nr:sulfatase [Armatimonadota bacterium]